MKSFIARIFPMLLLVAVLVVFVISAEQVGNRQCKQETKILEDALNKSITECYALEGAYPASLAYLTDHYGLTYDADSYFIDYQYVAGNLRPVVTIIERQ